MEIYIKKILQLLTGMHSAEKENGHTGIKICVR